jgi:hypothetical protein
MRLLGSGLCRVAGIIDPAAGAGKSSATPLALCERVTVDYTQNPQGPTLPDSEPKINECNLITTVYFRVARDQEPRSFATSPQSQRRTPLW